MERDSITNHPPNDIINEDMNLPTGGADNPDINSKESISYNIPNELIEMIVERVAQSFKNRSNHSHFPAQREDELTGVDQTEDEHKASYQGFNPKYGKGLPSNSNINYELHDRPETPRHSRSRSNSRSNRSRSDQYDSDNYRDDRRHTHDTESGTYSSEDYTPEPPRKRKRTSKTHHEDDSFPYNGETYITFNSNKHTIIDATKISWGNEIVHVKWFPGGEKKAFCQIKAPPPSKTPYMDQNVAHNNLLTVLGLESWVGDNPGLKRKGFSTDFELNNGLGQVIQLLKRNKNALIQASLSGNDADIS